MTTETETKTKPRPMCYVVQHEGARRLFFVETVETSPAGALTGQVFLPDQGPVWRRLANVDPAHAEQVDPEGAEWPWLIAPAGARAAWQKAEAARAREALAPGAPVQP